MALSFCSGQIRKPIRVVLYGFDNGDGSVTLVDRNGDPIGNVSMQDVGKPTPVPLSRPEWELRIGRMVHQFQAQNSDAYYAMLSEWDRKVQVWLRTQQESVRRRSHSRYFSPSTRRTWDDAIRCMIGQFKNAEHKAKFSSDPWNQWSETVSRNHRRKGQANGDAMRAAGVDRKPGVQMRWDWSRASA